VEIIIHLQHSAFSYNLLVIDATKISYTTGEMAPSIHTTPGNKIISQLQTLNCTCKTSPINVTAEGSRVGKEEEGRWKGKKVPASNPRDSFEGHGVHRINSPPTHLT